MSAQGPQRSDAGEAQEIFLRNYNYCDLIVKVLLTLGLHAVFIEFCKIYG